MSYSEKHRQDPTHPGHREHQPKGRKDTRRWCKGKAGREHTPEVQMSTSPYARCNTAPSWWRDGPWWCRHQLVCTACGKILEYFLPWRQCPDLPEHLRKAS